MKKAAITTLSIIILLGTSIGGARYVAAATPTPSASNPAIHARSTQEINTAFNSPASNLRLQMNNLMHEHAAVGAVTLTALYEGANTTGLMQQMTTNGNQIASYVQQAYGMDAHNTFVTLWTQHMQEYQNYTVARKNNDTAKMNSAKQHLQMIAVKIGNLFGAGQSTTANDVSSAMTDHIDGTLAIVDAVAKGNTTQTALLTGNGYNQAGTLADVMTRAMLLHNPNAF